MLPDMATHTFYIKPGDSYEVKIGDSGGPYMREVNRLTQSEQPTARIEHLQVRPGDVVTVVAPHATVYVKAIKPADSPVVSAARQVTDWMQWTADHPDVQSFLREWPSFKGHLADLVKACA